MKVLLTGANGFVGSHIVDVLCEQGIPCVLLLRRGCDQAFLQDRFGQVEIRNGSITQPESLPPALSGITHVIHCAGCTKAVRPSGFYAVNQTGTRNLIDAVNAHAKGLVRFLHISSLAAAGPSAPGRPVTEKDSPKPVSEYGRSKLQAELEVRNHCRPDFVILRPPAVYGPRDRGFLSLFQAVKNHILPLTNRDQALSLVYVRDLAAAIVRCLDHPDVVGQTYFVASEEVVTGRTMAEGIAAQIKTWTLPLPLPAAGLWPVCFAQDVVARLINRPALLSLAKFPELVAPGWVCNPGRLQAALGSKCATSLSTGLAQTLQWYRQNSWL